jgi:hypothetical protein
MRAQSALQSPPLKRPFEGSSPFDPPKGLTDSHAPLDWLGGVDRREAVNLFVS